MGTIHHHFTKSLDTEDYLNAVLEVAQYIKAHEIVDANGKHWALSGDPHGEPNLAESGYLNIRNLYAGAAGIGYFLIQLYEVTNDEQWLNDAKAAGDYLTNTYDPGKSTSPGVFAGTAGEGVLLYLLYQKTKEEKYRDQALRIADDAYAYAVKEDNGHIHWDSYFDYMGDGGVILYWLRLFRETGEKKYLDYAGQGIESLLPLGVEFDDGTKYWKLFDPAVYFRGIPKGGVIANFVHGTAGIVYILTQYYNVTKDAKYLEEAEKGYRYLRKIAVEDKDSSIVPYIYLEDKQEPYWVYYLGFCHGPVGDAVAVRELYKATGDREYLDFYKRLTRALIKRGVPERHSPGYWNDCLCCGSAGVIFHFNDAAKLLGDKSLLKLAKETADKSISDSYVDKTGRRWYNPWTRVEPWNVDSHLGLYVGAAGSASAILTLYADLKKIPITRNFNWPE